MTATNKGMRRPRMSGLPPQALDALKRSIALAVLREFTPSQIRAQILANLYRWGNQGVWASAYGEWQDIAQRGDDGELVDMMLGRDDTATRLRESMPFVGLLPQSEVRRLKKHQLDRTSCGRRATSRARRSS
jgi:hypothetical protein